LQEALGTSAPSDVAAPSNGGCDYCWC
jgi:hypothetical protein